MEATPDEIDVVFMLAEAIDVTSPSTPSLLPGAFRSLSARDKLVMITRLGLKRRGGSTVDGEIPGAKDATGPGERVASILRDWPLGFRRFVAGQEDRRLPGQGVLSSYPAIRLLLGSTSNSDFIMPELARLIFLKEFLGYLDDKETEAPRSIGRMVVPSEGRWASMRAAARSLDIDPRTLKRMIAVGELNGRAFDAGRPDKIYVERSDIARITKEHLPRSDREILRASNEALTLVETGKLFGITPRNVRPLIDHGLVQVIRSGARTYIARSSVQDLLDRLRECVRPTAAARDASSTFNICEAIQWTRLLHLTPLLDAVLSGNLCPVRYNDGAIGLQAIEFLRTDVAVFVALDRAATGHMHFAEALATLGCDKGGLRLLLKKGFIQPGRTKTEVVTASVHSFLAKHASAGKLAREMGTKPDRLVNRLRSAGLCPVSFCPKSKASFSFWTRSEVARAVASRASPDAFD